MDDVVVVERDEEKFVRCKLWGGANTRARHYPGLHNKEINRKRANRAPNYVNILIALVSKKCQCLPRYVRR
jgi:hypothetical protein